MKVIVHLGFPKTASSTMQFGPLVELERQGVLNLRTWRKVDRLESLDRRPSSRLFLNQNILPEYLDFSDTKINVLSDESFTAPLILRKCNYGDSIASPFSFPQKIRNQIVALYPNKDIEFVWFGVIRNQSNLIQSQYVEEYNWKRYKNIDLLFDSAGEIDLSGYEIYKFSEYLRVVNQLSEEFGDNYKFLLYEDMRFRPDEFFGALDELFNSDKGFFKASFEKSHVNGKNKSPYGTFTKDGSHFVPKMSDSIGIEIIEHFYSHNNDLIDFFQKEDLLEYGYIRA